VSRLEAVSEKSEQNNRAGQVEQAEETARVVLVPHGDAPVVLQPGKQPFDFPPPYVTPQWPPVLGGCFLSISHQAERRDDFDISLRLHALIELVAIVGLVADEALRLLGGEPAVQCGIDQRHLMWRSTSSPNGDRMTILLALAADFVLAPALMVLFARTAKVV
jgi:hypothetical protein